MKTKILSLALALAAGIGLTSCDGNNWFPEEETGAQGQVKLGSLKVDVENDEKVVSRAEISTADFLVDILDKSTGAVKRSYTYGDMPEVVSIAPGSYTLNVRSHKVKDAEWDAPYYVGSADFSIEAGKITEVGKVLCKFSNIKVTVRYSAKLLSYLGSDARVRVVANDRGTLDYAPTETRAGYFEAVSGSSTLVAEFLATIEGNQVQAIKTFNDVKAAQHYVITFDVKEGQASIPDEFGTVAPPGLTVDANIEHEDHSGSADPGQDNQQGNNQRPGDEEWPDDPTPPGPDDPNPPTPGEEDVTFLYNGEKPTTNPIVDQIKNGAQYLIKIMAEKGITHLKVNISSTNQEFLASAGEMLPMTFDLVTVEGDTMDNLDSIGLPVGDAVKGKPDVDFDITGLVPLLSGFKGTHTFKVDVSVTGDEETEDGEQKAISGSITLQIVNN